MSNSTLSSDSNTTYVNVKHILYTAKITIHRDSNTTYVNVKPDINVAVVKVG